MNGFAKMDLLVVQARATKDSRMRQQFSSVATWAAQINDHYEREKSGTMELARTLYAAKCQLQRGQWMSLWKSGLVPFRRSKGQMLAVIGEKLGLLNVQTSAHLPSGWNTLYQLARLDRAVLEALIADGFIHRGLTLAQARALVAKHNGLKQANRPRLERWLDKVASFVSAELDTWSPEEQRLAQSLFLDLAGQIADGAKRGGLTKQDQQRTAHSPAIILIVQATMPSPPPDGRLIEQERISSVNHFACRLTKSTTPHEHNQPAPLKRRRR